MYVAATSGFKRNLAIEVNRMVSNSSGNHRQRKGFGILQVSAIFIMGCFIGGNLNSFGTSSGTKLPLPDSTVTSVRSTDAGSSSGVSRDYGNGWHSIEVFYGNSSHFERKLDKDRIWYSQVSQDQTVSKMFREKRNGFFVDLAANDASALSNSYALEKMYGWTGLCIEPNPSYWSDLAYRDCQVVAAVVGKERMEEVLFRFVGKEYGGIAGEGFDNSLKQDSDPRYTVTLAEIFKRFNAPKVIDYLSLDVEGAEGFIMENFPLSEYNVSVLTCERPKDPLKALLVKKGYKQFKDLGDFGETLWAHESVMDTLDLSAIETL